MGGTYETAAVLLHLGKFWRVLQIQISTYLTWRLHCKCITTQFFQLLSPASFTCHRCFSIDYFSTNLQHTNLSVLASFSCGTWPTATLVVEISAVRGVLTSGADKGQEVHLEQEKKASESGSPWRRVYCRSALFLLYQFLFWDPGCGNYLYQVLTILQRKEVMENCYLLFKILHQMSICNLHSNIIVQSLSRDHAWVLHCGGPLGSGAMMWGIGDWWAVIQHPTGTKAGKTRQSLYKEPEPKGEMGTQWKGSDYGQCEGSWFWVWG